MFDELFDDLFVLLRRPYAGSYELFYELDPEAFLGQLLVNNLGTSKPVHVKLMVEAEDDR